MKSRLVPLLLFLLLATGFGYYVWQSQAQLPMRAATHFNWQGAADGWMGRDELIRFTLMLGLGVPLFIIIVFSSLRFVPVRLVNVPNREHWLSPEHQSESIAWVGRAGLWLASALLIFMGIVHFHVIQANTLTPPRLDSKSLIAAASGLLVFQIVFIVRIFLRFSKPATK